MSSPIAVSAPVIVSATMVTRPSLVILLERMKDLRELIDEKYLSYATELGLEQFEVKTLPQLNDDVRRLLSQCKVAKAIELSERTMVQWRLVALHGFVSQVKELVEDITPRCIEEDVNYKLQNFDRIIRAVEERVKCL